MAVAIKVPSLGESISEGVLAQWLKKDGDMVKEAEPLFELETDKATQSIPAPASGILHITVSEGENVNIGAEVGSIDPKESKETKEPDKGTKEEARDTPPKKETPRGTREEPKKKPSANEQHREAPRDDEKIGEPTTLVNEEEAYSPAVRRLVQERGVDLSRVTGTGRGGRVTKEDVIHYLEQEKEAPAAKETEKPKPETKPKEAKPGLPPPPREAAEPVSQKAEPSRDEHRQRMSPIRQRIAQRMLSSQQTTATLTTFNEADLSAVMELRSRYKEKFKEKHEVSLGFMAFFVKACVEALKAFPVVNSRIDGTEIVTPNYYHIGVAVSTDKGLMVPVVHDADRKSFGQIEKTIGELAVKARDGHIGVEDLQGGTFTITNGGVFGSLLSTPILYPGQSAILGMHTIQKRPVVVNDQVAIRPMMYLALSYDHRLIDGREAVQFLVRVKECIENPERMLLEV